MVKPQPVEDVAARDRLVRRFHEERQELCFPLRESGHSLLVAGLARLGIQRQTASLERLVGVGDRLLPAELCAEACHQFIERERLDDVVVSARGQSLDAVGDLVLCAEEEDRAIVALLSEGSAKVVTRAVR